ncbi:MAG: alkaline phosphatase D family protein [Pseudomonadales bacterium]|nr:alkaline phosphatase D family protein [Pseudomonadales bacterium]
MQTILTTAAKGNNAMLSRRQLLSRGATAALLSATGTATEARAPTERFAHGVASGDPLANSVILWTRISGGSERGDRVKWRIAADPAMRQVVNGGEVTALPWRDHCVKVDADGLEDGRTWYYQFECNGQKSPIGRTRTLPVGDVSALRFAVVSCSNFPFGFFNAYGRIAAREDLDAVLHLGDYIYEYAPGDYGDGSAIGRAHQPAHEIVTLADYRQRHAQYRSDPDLRAAHQQHPWITVWDDHESANNSWRDGAENHQPANGEGNWPDRRRAAERAYFEWMPIREHAGNRGAMTWRSFRFGTLCDLIMLDTRLWGRSEQVANRLDDMAMNATGRSILGADQQAWLAEELRTSRRDGSRWRLLGQQCMFSQLLDAERHVLNTDQWDGYPASRAAILDQLAAEQIDNTVILTGDIHSAWALDVTRDPWNGYDPQTGSGSLAVELITTSVTSPGPFGDEAKALEYENRFMTQLPHLRWTNFRQHGYLLVTLSADTAQADWWMVDTIASRSEGESLARSMRIDNASNCLARA